MLIYLKGYQRFINTQYITEIHESQIGCNSGECDLIIKYSETNLVSFHIDLMSAEDFATLLDSYNPETDVYLTIDDSETPAERQRRCAKAMGVRT